MGLFPNNCTNYLEAASFTVAAYTSSPIAACWDAVRAPESTPESSLPVRRVRRLPATLRRPKPSGATTCSYPALARVGRAHPRVPKRGDAASPWSSPPRQWQPWPLLTSSRRHSGPVCQIFFLHKFSDNAKFLTCGPHNI